MIVSCKPPSEKRNWKKKKKEKYLDLARGLKNLWNMKMTLIPVIIGNLKEVLKGLEKYLGELEIWGGRIMIIQIEMFNSEYSKESWRYEETCSHSGFNEKPPLHIGVWKFQSVIIALLQLVIVICIRVTSEKCWDRDETINLVINECSKLVRKELTRLAWEDDPLGIVQQIKIWLHYKMKVCTNLNPSWEWDT